VVMILEKIQIFINNDSISFTTTTDEHLPEIELDYTNVITDNELTFTKKYITENEKMVSLFITELCREKNVYRASLESNELALLLCDLFKKNTYITAICIRENQVLPFSIYEKIIENKNINYIEAYNIQTYMVELFDKAGIRSESRTEIFYTSHFMQSNNLTNYSKIFYKMNIRIDQPLSSEDKDDFLAFANINKYLKTIHIDIYNKDDLETVLKILIENKLKNIRILLYDTIKNYKTIDYLKKLNKKLKQKKKKIKIELVYSKEYLKENLFAQIIVNTLKICGLIMTFLVISIISYISISNYISLKQVNEIQENIKEVIEEKKEENLPPPSTDQNKEIVNNYILSVLSINPDVVGWLKVNNTNVDYPVVQSLDNDFYLQHNLYKDKDKNGWIYMDYRNSNENLDRNTIIFGHNMYYSGVMFGTLANATKKSWYENPENQIISYDSLYESNKYQIFSIYIIPKTSDYLKTYFANDDEFIEFSNMLKNRSIHNFNIDIQPDDKIITLSTCSNHTNRLVIHAKLLKET